jgi:hypothetical protein
MKQQVVRTLMGMAAGLWLASAHAAVPDPAWLGTWAADMSKSQLGPLADPTQPPPKSLTFTFKDAGGGKWSYQQTVVLADGKKVEPPGGTFTTDGKPSPVASDPNYDTVTVTYPDARTEIVIFFKGGKQVQKMTTALSADGKHRTQTVDSTDKDGKPVHGTILWDKK